MKVLQKWTKCEICKVVLKQRKYSLASLVSKLCVNHSVFLKKNTQKVKVWYVVHHLVVMIKMSQLCRCCTCPNRINYLPVMTVVLHPSCVVHPKFQL